MKARYRWAWGSPASHSGSSGNGEAYHLDSGQIETVRATPSYVAVEAPASGTPNSPRAEDFWLLNEVIHRLADLPIDDPFYVDEKTSAYASNLAGLIRGFIDIDVPKIFPQDAEALVMTWDEGEFERLLTIAGDEVSLLDLHKQTQFRCFHDVGDGDDAMANLIPLLASSGMVRSSSVED